MIRVNGEPHEWHPGITVADILADMELRFPIYTVRVNGSIVPKDEYGEHRLRDGSELDIIYIIAGG